eukprot:SAG31_NODE_23808_length_495_cov_0.904040_1_plen_25_part_01
MQELRVSQREIVQMREELHSAPEQF